MGGNSRNSVRPTVCVVSSHPLVLRNVGDALAKRFRTRIYRIDPTPARVVEEPQPARLYVLDGQLPAPTTAGLVDCISRRFPRSRVVVVAEHFREADTFGLLRMGVKGLVRYDELHQTLPLAIDTVAAGSYWVPRALLSRFIDDVAARSPGRRIAGAAGGLTAREREVLESVLQNLSNKEIAQRLRIAERTVKFHVSNLLAKLQLKSRQELIIHCLSSSPEGK